MADFREEQIYIQSAAAELKEYLLSGAATWQMSARISLPPLSPGTILLYSQRLLCYEPARGMVTVQKALEDVNKIRLQWKSAWQGRILQEIPQRASLWTEYVTELARQRSAFHQYAWKARWRVMLQLMLAELETDAQQEERKALQAVDTILSLSSRPGPFVWEAELQRCFDQKQFWYLYLQGSS